MADFKLALAKTLNEEQYWADLDGGTYRGVVRKAHPDWPGWRIIDIYIRKIGRPLRHNERIPNIHLDALIASFYRSNFWSVIRGDDIDSQAVADILFDWTVTSWNDATKALQALVGVQSDGIFGPRTLEAVNAAGSVIETKFRKSRVAFYTKVGGPYWKSWVARAKRV